MKKCISIISIFLSFSLFSAAKQDFELIGMDGEKYQLSQYANKIVVLEWLNHGCPYVKKHYHAQYRNMQNLQKYYVNKGVIWLSIISSAPGKQGHSTPEQAQKDYQQHKSFATMVLLDETGQVGQMYQAKTTPHMFVLDRKHRIVYQGAIDDKVSTNIEDIKDATNYVKLALDQVLKGEKIQKPMVKAYGCSVKY